MIQLKNSAQIIPIVSLIICVLYFVYQATIIETPLDSGDGIQHFFIANGALKDHSLFLDHWGKPFFILSTSLFSILGLNGIILFNIIIFCLTCFVAYKSFNLLKISFWLQSLFPLALIYSYDYDYVVLSGLTEPLTGFLIILIAYFLIKKQWIWAAIICSILPFARSEGQMIVVLLFLILSYKKQWKSLPFLVFSFIIYAIIGYFVFGDFLWYFSHNPYPSESVYGHGDWSDFFIVRENYIGGIGIVLLFLSLIGIGYNWLINSSIKINWELLFFGFSTFFGIVFVHAYLWKYGLRGSLGLTRVLTIGLPVFLLVSIYLTNLFFYSRVKTQFFILFPILLFSFYFYRKNILIVYHQNGIEKSVLSSAKFILEQKEDHERIYYTSPYFAYCVGINPLLSDTVFLFAGNIKYDKMNYGDFLVRDSHFAHELNVNLSDIEKNTDLVLVNEFIPSQPGKSYHGENWNVRVYQKIPSINQKEVSTIINDIEINQSHFEILADNEFTGETIFKAPSNGVVQIEIKVTNQGGKINCEINDGESWSSYDLGEEINSGIKFPVKKGDKIKLYFWNPEKKSYKAAILSIRMISKNYHPIIHL